MERGSRSCDICPFLGLAVNQQDGPSRQLAPPNLDVFVKPASNDQREDAADHRSDLCQPNQLIVGRCRNRRDRRPIERVVASSR